MNQDIFLKKVLLINKIFDAAMLLSIYDWKSRKLKRGIARKSFPRRENKFLYKNQTNDCFPQSWRNYELFWSMLSFSILLSASILLTLEKHPISVMKIHAASNLAPSGEQQRQVEIFKLKKWGILSSISDFKMKSILIVIKLFINYYTKA